MGMIVIDSDELDRIIARHIAPLAQALHSATVTPAPEWVTIPEAAQLRGVTTSTVRRWITEGRVVARGSGRNRQVRLA